MAQSSPHPEGPALAAIDPATADEFGHQGQLLVHPESVGKRVNLRLWFALFLLWLVALTAAARMGFALHQGGDGWYRVWLLSCFAFYLSLACTFLPLPTTPIVALAAVPDLGIAPSIAARTMLIAAVGAAASMMANLNEYHLWTYVLQHRKVSLIRHTRLYGTAVRWFNRSAWLTMLAFTFIPIPVDVIRLLAITFKYPRWRFATASYTGRFARYAILAGAVAWSDKSAWQLVIGITILTVGGGLTFGVRRIWQLVRGR